MTDRQGSEQTSSHTCWTQCIRESKVQGGICDRATAGTTPAVSPTPVAVRGMSTLGAAVVCVQCNSVLYNRDGMTANPRAEVKGKIRNP